MFNFGGITHICDNPNKTFSAVGSVPIAMMRQRTPTMSDIMGGRVQTDGFAYVGKAYATVDEFLADAKAANAKLCNTPTCLCRKHF